MEPVSQQAPQATVIPGADSLIGDLLDMDLGPPSFQMQQQQQQQQQAPASSGGGLDLLSEGLDSLLGGGGSGMASGTMGADMFGGSGGGSTLGGLGEIFGINPSSSIYVPPQEVCL